MARAVPLGDVPRGGRTAACAKGADALPHERSELEDALGHALDRAALRRALGAVTSPLLRELEETNEVAARVLREPPAEMAGW